MARRKTTQPDESADGGGQINFRAGKELFGRLQNVSNGLGLDMANLVRMIVTENLPLYESRVRQIRQAQPDD